VISMTTIELSKEEMKFSAGHFTIFSATERERLHGHNFRVYAAITAEVGPHGLAFDYAIYKKILLKLCASLDEYFLLPSQSEFLTITETNNQLVAGFNEELIPFLKTDVKLLPLRNITVEELSRWFVEELSRDQQQLQEFKIHAFTVTVSSGPSQSAATSWERT